MPDQRHLKLDRAGSGSGVCPSHRTDPVSECTWPDVMWASRRVDGGAFALVAGWPSSRHEDKSGPGMEPHGTRLLPGPTVRMTKGWEFGRESALSHMIRAREVLRSSSSCPGNSEEQKALVQQPNIHKSLFCPDAKCTGGPKLFQITCKERYLHKGRFKELS